MTQKESNKKRKPIKGVPLSPHDEAMLECGKAMLADSVKTSRDFCKYMISVSTGSIPIYLGLLGLLAPKDFVAPLGKEVWIFVTAGLFLLASIIFVIGYFPQSSRISLDDLKKVKKERDKTLITRQIMSWLGFAFFLLGVVFATISVTLNLKGG